MWTMHCNDLDLHWMPHPPPPPPTPPSSINNTIEPEYCMNPDRGKEIWATQRILCQIYCRINSSRVNWFVFSLSLTLSKMKCQFQLLYGFFKTKSFNYLNLLFPPYIGTHSNIHIETQTLSLSIWRLICKTEPFAIHFCFLQGATNPPDQSYQWWTPSVIGRLLSSKAIKTVDITQISPFSKTSQRLSSPILTK